ncbi:MAG: DCC1-like thiol-disulfide oxidoreductase family protein [bacterium]
MRQSQQTDSSTSRDPGLPRFIVFIDADCIFCSNSAAWMLRNDPRGQVHIAALQGETARRVLPALGIDDDYLQSIRADNSRIDSIICVDGVGGDNPRLYGRSRASRMIARRMGFPWNLLGWLSWWIPDPVLDWLYNLVKRNRHRLAKERCALPGPELRLRYLD